MTALNKINFTRSSMIPIRFLNTITVMKIKISQMPIEPIQKIHKIRYKYKSYTIHLIKNILSLSLFK